MKFYLIQGFFFQDRESISRGFLAGYGLGAVVNTNLVRFMFSGTFFPDPDDSEKLVGEIHDHFGQSMVYDMVLMPDALGFTKKYDERHDRIEYGFTRQGNLWVGSYNGEETGTGPAQCIITEVPEMIFKPPVPT